MKYCKITTINHPISLTYPNCIEDINSLFIREGYASSQKPFINNEVILNLDFVESEVAPLANRPKNRSMDFTFGLSNNGQSIQLMVLAELKLNQQNPNQLKREHLEEKVAGSMGVLNNSIDIYANYIFIFRSDKKEEAKSRFFRMNPKIPNEYLVMDIEEFYNTFF